MKHELKTWPDQFKGIWNGSKKFEVRKNDRPFFVQDTLLLREYEPSSKQYTGRECEVLVTYILRAPFHGLCSDYCIMSIDIIRRAIYSDLVHGILKKEE